jgi:probable phosphoglycerate mutase
MRFDGGASPNPGPAAGAAVLFDVAGTPLFEKSLFIEHGTNNMGEYSGLIAGLELALSKGVRLLRVEGDSQLVINQMSKKWAIRNAALMPLYIRANELAKEFDRIDFGHIYRDSNSLADKVSDETIAGRCDIRERACQHENSFVGAIRVNVTTADIINEIRKIVDSTDTADAMFRKIKRLVG